MTANLFQEERNKFPISEPSKLFLSPTTVQWWAIVKIADYHL